MAELNGREVTIVNHLGRLDDDKVLIETKEKETKAVYLKDLTLTGEEQKNFMDHTHKILDTKVASWETKRRAKRKQQAEIDYKAHIATPLTVTSVKTVP